MDFHLANGDMEEIESGLSKKPDVVLAVKFCKDGRLDKLKVMLDPLPKDQRKTLVDHEIRGSTPLVMACRNGHSDIVRYLVDACNADTSLPGSVVFDGETIEGAPPLWCAAAAGFLDIVAYLVGIKHVNVNQTTLTNSTPLRAACFDGHLKIVRYLVDNKADIEIANRHGHTCLMIACFKGHLPVVKYLVSKGAKVNRKSFKGNTALHDCAECGSLEIMKLLMNNGAELVKDSYGISPLIAAAVGGYRNIIDYLLAVKKDIPRVDRIDALELLGATLVDKKRDFTEAANVWRMAFNERRKTPSLRKPINPTRYKAYNDALEVQEAEELETLFGDPDQVRMQALIIRERILGPTHPDTTYYMRYRGALYADMGNFTRCITLWVHALELQMSALEPLSAMTMSSFMSFAELFAFMLQDIATADNHAKLDMNLHAKDILCVMQHGLSEIQRFRPNTDLLNENCVKDANKPPDKNVKEDALPKMLSIMLHLMCLMNSVDCCSISKRLSEGEEDKGDSELLMKFRRLVYTLVKLDMRSKEGGTLLHLACSEDTTHIGRYPICAFPAKDVVELLLMVDADPNARDTSGNTPLHYMTSSLKAGSPLPCSYQAIMDMLITRGAHVDFCNHNHKSPLDNLALTPKVKWSAIHPVKHTSLKCLAARVLLHNHLPYGGLVDSLLEKFVDAH